MKPELDRRLVAVVFTDMVGYTAMIEADERLAVDLARIPDATTA